MKEAYVEWEPKSAANRQLLADTQAVVEEYVGMGYVLTLRQLYYQLVSRDILPNNDKQYKRLGELVKNGREAGHIDWNAIEDRGRVLVSPPEWSSPKQILIGAARQFRLNRWRGQDHYVEVWCEKDALSSVLEPVCDRWHVRFMANRGYSSATAMHRGAQRLAEAAHSGQQPAVIYLGDHDPSGIDMSRDIENRLDQFARGRPIEVRRLALNFDQVQQYRPPPNPAKFTDSRATGYAVQYGRSCWELDALDPVTLDALLDAAIREYLDEALYDGQVGREKEMKAQIREFADSLA